MQRLIDADALKERKFPNGESEYLTGWNDAISAIMTFQPTIDAEPVRHGKWIFNPSDAFEAMFAKPKCSECGFESADGGNYCPNCGARMDAEDDKWI